MAIKNIDHIAVLVKNLDDALAVWRDGLGMTLAEIQTVPEQDVRVAFLPSGSTQIELLEPMSEESGIGRYLAKRGEGMHHICLEVDDIDATLAELKARGTPLIDETPKRGAHGRIAFVHPRATRGVLVELVEHDHEEHGA